MAADFCLDVAAQNCIRLQRPQVMCTTSPESILVTCFITLILVNRLPHLSRSTITLTCPFAFYKMLSKESAAITTSILRNRETGSRTESIHSRGEGLKGEERVRRTKSESRQTEKADAFLWELIIPLPQKLILVLCTQTYQKASLNASYTAI